MFSRASGISISGGTFNATTINQSKRGIDFLLESIATDAFHNSKGLYDAPKCHPHTRVAVLADIMKWVMESDSETQNDFIMWLFGPAGAGKSAIAKKIAELAAEKGILIGSFFFSRTSPTRNTQDRLIATLAYQMALSIPGARTHIEDAIQIDPAIFHKDIQTQIDTLLIKPFQSASTQTIPRPTLIIIDGLDECSNSQAQVAILNAISRSLTSCNVSIKCLIASRPEIDLVSSFNGNEPLKSIHIRLALDDTYQPDDDIRLFFSDSFKHISCTHRLRSTIPVPWPTEETLDELVKRSSGQFIFAATVVRFVESNRYRPAARLNIILGISPPGTTNPFTEVDALYKQILSSVEGIQLTMRVLSFYVSSPRLAYWLGKMSISEQFLSLEEGDIDFVLINLSSIISYNESTGEAKILHASLVDFLSDKHRSAEFYIDIPSTRSDFLCRIFQYIKGPDGMRAGDIRLFHAWLLDRASGWILNSQVRNEILNFDLDALVTAAVKSSSRTDATARTFSFWKFLINGASLDDGDTQFLMHRWRNSLEWRIQKYQSDWRLQLLLTLAVATQFSSQASNGSQPRCLDILLGMNDRNLHLFDQNALDLRYSGGSGGWIRVLWGGYCSDITSRHVDGDSYASAALHCMRFLSNPPKYFETGRDASPEIGITYADWRATCAKALGLLCGLLDHANTSLEVIQFMSDHDVSPNVRELLPVIDVWRADLHSLAFLSRGGACVNWRIIAAIQQSSSVAGKWINSPFGRNIVMTSQGFIGQESSESEQSDSESSEGTNLSRYQSAKEYYESGM